MADDRFEQAYQAGGAAWDIGRPQGAIVRLAEAGEIRGTVLDVGCGTGENALYLASRGRPVLGIDLSQTAIATAQQKAAARGLQATFRVHDALRLTKLRWRFETAIDVGFFHTLGDEQRRPYAMELCDALGAGSVLHILCFSDEEPPGPGPRRVEEYDIRATFRSLFAMVRVERAEFETNRPEGNAKAWLATLQRI
ncbi:MAG: class I SAM-dependent methyltransferase [Anaeromyxobacteraceae bacterium]